MKRIASLALAGILALTAVAPVAAAETGGTTSETLDIAATISMTVPASIAYTQGKALNTANVTLSNLSTDNPSGMSVSIKVNADGAGKIPVASRSFQDGPTAGTWVQTASTAVPSSTTEAGILYYSANNPSVTTVTFASKVNASAFAPGSYTGSLIFRAYTNNP